VNTFTWDGVPRWGISGFQPDDSIDVDVIDQLDNAGTKPISEPNSCIF